MPSWTVPLSAIVSAAALALASAANASVIIYQADLTGPGESPPNASLGTGEAFVTIDDIANTMEVDVTFSGLTGTTTASHIHCCTTVADTGTAGVATTTPTFPNFPLGVTSGSYDRTFDLTAASTYNGAFVTANGGTAAGAEAALLAGLASGKAYLNVHSTFATGGEIRGFLTAVPEPASWALMILGFGFSGAALRRRRLTLAA